MSADGAASRLCAECGLCCNGVMFHTVKLQPKDSPKELLALGLKLKRKKKGWFILQPCPAHRGSQCSIYSARPERCRLFECRQLKRVAAGEVTEADALAKIRDAQARVAELDALLNRAGATNTKRPIAKRCEAATAEPLDDSADLETVSLRERLTREMAELDAILDQDFRVGSPAADAP